MEMWKKNPPFILINLYPDFTDKEGEAQSG